MVLRPDAVSPTFLVSIGPLAQSIRLRPRPSKCVPPISCASVTSLMRSFMAVSFCAFSVGGTGIEYGSAQKARTVQSGISSVSVWDQMHECRVGCFLWCQHVDDLR